MCIRDRHSAVIDGGYKSYRKAVLDDFDQLPAKFRLVILSGPTGTAKTHILRSAAKNGLQVLDLEGLANHRGSLLGSEPGSPQPAQRLFESRLCAALQNFTPDRPIFIEAESNKIGQIHIPSALWATMQLASRVSLTAPIDARIAFLQRDYRHITEQPDHLIELLAGLRQRYSTTTFDLWKRTIKNGDWHSFIHNLLETHYDPSYARSSASRPLTDILTLSAKTLDDDDIARLATALGTLGR